jgi:hypothetical protein
MEIVDEILTPGCPNCAIKHLSAALAIIPELQSLSRNGWTTSKRSLTNYEVDMAVARINFIEAMEGYESHWDYGVGLLVGVEDKMICEGEESHTVNGLRGHRCAAMTATDYKSRHDVVRFLTMPPDVNMDAHLAEAFRELPELFRKAIEFGWRRYLESDELTKYITLAKIIIKLIKWVRDEFFATEQTNDFETKENEEKGGEAMAMEKATAKKAPAKAAAKKAPVKAAAKKACKK